jgi:hypothetical protein
MRKIMLTSEQAQICFSALDNPEPQKGLSVQEIRATLPLMDKLEANAERIPVQGGERIIFKDQELKMKEAEYQLLLTKLETSSGWASMSVGRRVLMLVDALKELPVEQEPA